MGSFSFAVRGRTQIAAGSRTVLGIAGNILFSLNIPAICIIVDRFRFSVDCASVCSKHLKMEAGMDWTNNSVNLYLVYISDRRDMT